MSGANSFGSRFVVTTFGESHGEALGAVIDGMPAGIKWDDELLINELRRRRPGQSQLVSARGEEDQPEVLSGVYLGQTLGTPIAVVVRNHDAKSEDYRKIAKKPRTGHADDVWRKKFGHSDPRGGGRSSGRETLSRVIGGTVAKMLIRKLAPNLKIRAFATQVGPLSLSADEIVQFAKSRKPYPADSYAARFPSRRQTKELESLLLDAKDSGLSYGGTAELWIDGAPLGLGQPVFRKLKADLAAAFMGVGATAAVEIGDGIIAAHAEGSEFHGLGKSDPARYGGMRGGISTGERIKCRVTFKPTSSVLDVAKKGRHDPCIVPRAIPVLEAMASLVMADHLMWIRSDRAE